MQYIVDE
jgi:lysosomal Pro-X carboxypeptidase